MRVARVLDTVALQCAQVISVTQLVPERHQDCPVPFPAGRSELLIHVLLEVGQDRVVVEKRVVDIDQEDDGSRGVRH